MKNHTIDLIRIFELERLESDHRLSPLALLSAASGSHDHDKSERLALLRKLIRENKRICKDGGGIYSDQELLSMPFDTFKKLYDQAESEDSTNITGEKRPANDGKKIVNLSAVFGMENALTLLSARVATSQADKDDAKRYALLTNMRDSGRVPVKENGFDYFTAAELARMPLKLLQLLHDNCRPSTRVL